METRRTRGDHAAQGGSLCAIGHAHVCLDAVAGVGIVWLITWFLPMIELGTMTMRLSRMRMRSDLDTRLKDAEPLQTGVQE